MKSSIPGISIFPPLTHANRSCDKKTLLILRRSRRTSNVVDVAAAAAAAAAAVVVVDVAAVAVVVAVVLINHYEYRTAHLGFSGAAQTNCCSGYVQ